MQDFNWNDVKYLLALHRCGTLAAAARVVGVNETTVARRVRKLEKDLGTTLVVSSANGRFHLSQAANAILDTVEAMEEQSLSLGGTLRSFAQSVPCRLRISAVPWIANRVLVPSVSQFFCDHPNILLDILPDAANRDLKAREADFALRFARPVEGGHRIRAKKIAVVGFGVFTAAAAKGAAPRQKDGWIGYDTSASELPQARWTDALQTQSDGACAQIRVADLETAIEAVAQGLGKSVLPECVASSDPRLVRVDDVIAPRPMLREVWLLTRADQKRDAAHVVVDEWVTQTLRALS